MSETYTLDAYVADLREIVAEAGSESAIFDRLNPLAKRLATDRSWLKPEHYHIDAEQGFGVHLLHEEPDHALAVFVVAWGPGKGAPPHDHGTWAVVAGVEGSERNIVYKRLDDRSKSDYAEIAVKDDFLIVGGEVIAMKSGGIHSVINESDAVSVSLHTYGKHLNYTGRSQFDTETNAKREFLVTVE